MQTRLSDELSYVSAAAIAERVRERDLSPVEVTEAFIERIEDRNPSLNALVFTDFENARVQAQEDEDAVASGESLGVLHGVLHGVPTAIKDLFDFKPGWTSTFGGIPALKDFVLDAYCAFAERAEGAGANILGKTNSPTMGFRGTCDNYLFGPTRNPFDTSRNSGGSSGGSAAAVADGLLPFAEGTDGGGSIRIPAAWCGVYGFKASFGRVPYIARPNAFGGDTPYLAEGPITRTVEDAALVLTAIGGYDARDPASTNEDVDYLGALSRDIRGMRIAYSPNFDVFPVDRRVATTVERAVRAFEEAGAHVEEVTVGIRRDQRELSDLWCRLITPVNLAAFDLFKRQGLDLLGDHRENFPPEYLEWMDRGAEMSALDLYRDQEMRTEIFDAVQGVFEDYDLLITPTLACPPVENTHDGNTKGPTEIEGVEVDPLIGWCMTYFLNYTGHPAASIPAGLMEGDLPVGMQIVGHRNADTDVLAASATFERLRPWSETYERCRTRSL